MCLLILIIVLLTILALMGAVSLQILSAPLEFLMPIVIVLVIFPLVWTFVTSLFTGEGRSAIYDFVSKPFRTKMGKVILCSLSVAILILASYLVYHSKTFAGEAERTFRENTYTDYKISTLFSNDSIYVANVDDEGYGRPCKKIYLYVRASGNDRYYVVLSHDAFKADVEKIESGAKKAKSDISFVNDYYKQVLQKAAQGAKYKLVDK